MTEVGITIQVPGHERVLLRNACDTRQEAERWATWRARHLEGEDIDVLAVDYREV